MRSSFLYSSKEIEVNSMDLIPQAFYLDTLFFVSLFCGHSRQCLLLSSIHMRLYDYIKINNNDYVEINNNDYDKISKRNKLK